MYIKIVNQPIDPAEVIEQAESPDSGCVATYVGLIRNISHNKLVRSVEYQDIEGKAESRLRELAEDIQKKFPVNRIALCHRVGLLHVGDINIVFAFGAAHRQEGFAACQYAVDRFKETMPTTKKETYMDETICTDW